MSTETTNKGYVKQAAGENPGTWGDPVLNSNFDIIDKNLGGSASIALTNSNVTLSDSQAENLLYLLTGTLSGNVAISWPQVGGIYIVANGTTGNFSVTLKTTNGASTSVVAPQGFATIVYSDGTNIKLAPDVLATYFALGGKTSASVSSDQNNYSLGTATAFVDLNITTACNFTGFAAPTQDGVIKIVCNVGTEAGTILTNNASSSSGNRVAGALPFKIFPGMAVILRYDLANTIWRVITPYTTQPISSGYKNLVIQNNSGAPNSTMDIDADAVTVEDGDGISLRLASVDLSGNVTSSGANGLDSGSVSSNTWYSIWVIYNPTTNTVSSLLSTSATSPTLPSGYTFKARLGWNRTNASSNFNRIIQKGNTALYKVVAASATPNLPIMDSGKSKGNVLTPVWVAVSVSSYVPSTAASILGAISTGGSSSTASVIAAPNNSYGALNSATNPPPSGCSNPAVTSSGMINQFQFMLESTNIYWASNGNADDAALMARGWIDNI